MREELCWRMCEKKVRNKLTYVKNLKPSRKGTTEAATEVEQIDGEAVEEILCGKRVCNV